MVIDLDVAPAAGASAVRLRRPARLWGLVVAALAFVLVGGSAPSAGPGGITEVLTIDGQGAMTTLLTTEALYTVRADGHVEAVPLCDGCPRWTSRATLGQRLSLAGRDTLILDGNQDTVATFLDARTGALRWRLRNAPFVDVIGGRVAAWDFEKNILWMRDLHTGRLLWSRPAASFAGDEASTVVLDDLGRATVLDNAGGREITPRRDLGLPQSGVRLMGDRLLLYDGGSVGVFRRDDLSRVWVTASDSLFRAAPCGDGLICSFGTQGLTVLGAADGKVRWRNDRWRGIRDGGLLTDENEHAARVDLATGRVEREFGRSAPLGDLLLTPQPDRTLVFGLADGRLRGALPQLLPSACTTAGPYVACETPDVTYAVWRLAG